MPSKAMNRRFDRSVLQIAMVILIALTVIGCKIDIFDPENGSSHIEGEAIHFNAEYEGTGAIQWESRHTDPDGHQAQLNNAYFNTNAVDLGSKGFPWEFEISTLQPGTHEIKAYKGSDIEEITITVMPFCENPDLDCTAQEDGVCTFGVCDEEANACVVDNADDGTVCDDGLVCTENDSCSSGQCLGNVVQCNQGELCVEPNGCVVQSECDDDDIYCTRDFLDETGKCTHTPDDSLCDDGDASTTDSCEPLSGCWHSHGRDWISFNGGAPHDMTFIEMEEVACEDTLGICYDISYLLRGFWLESICTDDKGVCFKRIVMPGSHYWGMESGLPEIPRLSVPFMDFTTYSHDVVDRSFEETDISDLVEFSELLHFRAFEGSERVGYTEKDKSYPSFGHELIGSTSYSKTPVRRFDAFPIRMVNDDTSSALVARTKYTIRVVTYDVAKNPDFVKSKVDDPLQIVSDMMIRGLRGESVLVPELPDNVEIVGPEPFCDKPPCPGDPRLYPIEISACGIEVNPSSEGDGWKEVEKNKLQTEYCDFYDMSTHDCYPRSARVFKRSSDFGTAGPFFGQRAIFLIRPDRFFA